MRFLSVERDRATRSSNTVTKAGDLYQDDDPRQQLLFLTGNFYASHQWLRELKRRNGGPIAGVYFRVPDEQMVWVGHYGQAHRFLTAAEAAAQFTKTDDPLVWEVVVPHRIEANEIHKTRRLPQVIGWRFSPNAKGKPPFCTCKFCTRGDYASAKRRRRLVSPDDK